MKKYSMYNQIKSITEKLNSFANKSKADWWNRYLKYTITFIGVPLPTIRKVLQKWYNSSPINLTSLKKLADDLISLSIAEYKIAGILIYQEYLLNKIKNNEIIISIHTLFSKKVIFDWNTCDWFCVRILTPIIDQENKSDISQILDWYKKEYVWQARAAIVSFAQSKTLIKHYKSLSTPMEYLIKREEKFAKTAVGWILREIYKFDIPFVKKFLKSNSKYLIKDIIRNALKYMDKQEAKAFILTLKSFS